MEAPRPGWYAIYTRALCEREVTQQAGQISGVEEVLLPEFHHLGNREGSGARIMGHNKLMFPNYVLLRANLTQRVIREITGIEGVCYMLGTSPETPSEISESEISLVRHLANAQRDPRLGEAPVKGRIAKVVSGPLSGVEGLVLWRNRNEARLATRLRMAAGSYEIRLPLNVLALAADCRWSNGDPAVPRHRSGDRSRRRRRLAA